MPRNWDFLGDGVVRGLMEAAALEGSWALSLGEGAHEAGVCVLRWETGAVPQDLSILPSLDYNKWPIFLVSTVGGNLQK